MHGIKFQRRHSIDRTPWRFTIRFEFDVMVDVMRGRETWREFGGEYIWKVFQDGLDTGILGIGIGHITFFCNGA